MDNLQNLLGQIVDLGKHAQLGEHDGWYPVLVGDPEEWNHARPTVGIMVQISGEPGRYTLDNVSSYNR